MPLTTYTTMRPAILLGSHAAQRLRTRELQPINDGTRSVRAHRHILRHRRHVTRRSFEHWLRAQEGHAAGPALPAVRRDDTPPTDRPRSTEAPAPRSGSDRTRMDTWCGSGIRWADAASTPG